MLCLPGKKMFVTRFFGKRMSRMSPNKILMFLIIPPRGNAKIPKLIAKHVFEWFEKRKGEDGKK